MLAAHTVAGNVSEQAWAAHLAHLVVEFLEMRVDTQIRDQAMASNVSWLANQDQKRKIILWAHNAHVSRDPKRMGGELDRVFGAKQVVIGFATGRGEYRARATDRPGTSVYRLTPAEPGTVEATCAAAEIPRFIVDLRPGRIDPQSPGAWFVANHPFRFIGAGEMDRQFRNMPVGKYYDFLVYLDETHSTVPVAGVD